MVNFTFSINFEKLGIINKMKNYIGIEFNNWKLHNLNLIEILANRVERGDKSSYLNLTSRLYPLFGTLFPFSNKCSDFISESIECLKVENGLEIAYAREFKWLRLGLGERLALSRSILTTPFLNLKDFRYLDNNCGRSIYSTIFSEIKSTHCNQIMFRIKFYQLAVKWISIFSSLNSYFGESHFDAVVIFNGRFFAENAAVTAANLHNLEVLYHESSSEPFSYTLEKFSPFAISDIASEVACLTKFVSKSVIEEIGTNWFINRINSRSPELQRFQHNWSDEYVHFQTEKKVAVFFTTSDDEFIGLDDNWNFGKFSSQFLAAANVLRLLSELDYYTVVRVHPNTANKAKAMEDQWYQLDDVNLIIDSRSATNSYALLRRADLVVVSGSTIGLEAAFLEKITATIGTSPHDGLQILVDLRNFENSSEIAQELLKYNISLAKEKSLQFAYWEATRTSFRKYLVPSKSPSFDDEYNTNSFAFQCFRASRVVYKKLQFIASSIFMFISKINFMAKLKDISL